MSKKTDRVIWQVTDTTGVPILGRVQAKLINYISSLKIHPHQEQSPVSQDSLKSTDYVHSLKTTNHSLQSTKTTQYKTQDYTQNQPEYPGAQSGNQGQSKHST